MSHDDNEDWVCALSAVDDLLSLPEDWDGYGAVRPNIDYVEMAHQLLIRLRNRGDLAPTRVMPLSTGGVLIEWQSSDQYVEAEISDLHTVEWMRRDADGTYVHYDNDDRR